MSTHTLSRTSFVFGAILALASIGPRPAHASPPAPDELVRLPDRLAHARVVRVTMPSGWLGAEGVRADAGGLALPAQAAPR